MVPKRRATWSREMKAKSRLANLIRPGLETERAEQVHDITKSHRLTPVL